MDSTDRGRLVWASASACILLSLILLWAEAAPDKVAGLLLVAGLAALGARGAVASARRLQAADAASRPTLARLAALCAAALLLAGLALRLGPALPPASRVAAGALAAQAMLVVLSAGPSASRSRLRRHALPSAGHAVILVGTVLTLLSGEPFSAAPGLAYASGFSILLLHAHWAQGSGMATQARAEGWGVVVLGAIVLGVGAMTLVYAGATRLLPVPAPLEAAALGTTLASGLVAFGLLCAPPPAPPGVRARAGSTLDVLAHGGAAIALLNVLFLGVSFVSGWSLRLVFGTLFAWQLAVIGMEYRTLRHAERRRRRGPAVGEMRRIEVLEGPRGDEEVPAKASPAEATRARGAGTARRTGGLEAEPLTVIVPAADEADVLPESMARNLAIPYPLRFILVPAAKSTDRTLEAARALAARHPDRVSVVEGSTGSKAGDLNLAWRRVTTPHVLLLDADETIDLASLLRGLDVLRARPDVGVVQGRKVSRAPGDGFLARFISAERRYCTWMDHVMHGDTLGSSHFGGSAALLRREVPEAVGGWSDQTLTEDIEFTLRLHLDGRWLIVYHPDMVVRESDPRDLQELLRQRTRWARGWAQCFGLYLPKVVERRRALGRRRAFGLAWLLLIAVSALWTTFVPATLLMRLAGISPLLPLAVAFPLTLILLPSRLLAYGYAAFRDPVIPLRFTPLRAAELVLHAYLWILFGWFVQLHAIYLELSSAPRVWYVTGKRGGRGKPRAEAA